MNLSHIISAAARFISKSAKTRRATLAGTRMFETLESRTLRSASPMMLNRDAAMTAPVATTAPALNVSLNNQASLFTLPINVNPIITNPIVTNPIVTTPIVTIPIVTNPIITNPIVTQPIITTPIVTQPIKTHYIEDAIQQKYDQMGGTSSFLGAAVGGEILNGHAQVYQNGEILWMPSTGAHDLSGNILAKFNGNPLKYGWPTSDQISSPSFGSYAHFQNGTIIAPKTSTQMFYLDTPTFNTIMDKGGFAALGNPLGDSTSIPGFSRGMMTQFKNGDYFASPSTGAHLLNGVFLAKYQQCDQSALGLPTSDQLPGWKETGTYCTFKNGAIYNGNNDPTHAFYVFGPTYQAWLESGGVKLDGYPTTDTMDYSKGTITYYQGDKIFTTPSGTTQVGLTSQTMSYNSDYLLTSGPVGGKAQLTLNENGSWSLSYQFNDSATFGTKYEYVVTVGIVSPTGNALSFPHSYYIGAGGDAGTIHGTNSNITKYWNDLLGGQFVAGATCGNTSWTGFWDGLGVQFGTPVPASGTTTGSPSSFYGSTYGDPNYSEPDAPLTDPTESDQTDGDTENPADPGAN